MRRYRGRLAAVSAVLVAAITIGLAPSAPAEDMPQQQASQVALLTGAESLNATEARYRITGTDLGIMWTDERGQILAAFGDTFGPAWTGHGSEIKDPAAVDWRSNTLARSSDRNPSDGVSFDEFVADRANYAKELLPSLKRNGVEITKIPTGGVNIGGRDYLAYMSVRQFGQPGRWITNYHGIAYSDDNGQSWVEVPSATRLNTPGFDEKFQMIAYAPRDGYVYAFGTPNGRFGDAHVARVPEQQLLDVTAYEYWNGTAWQRGSSALAVPVVTGPVGEISVRYDPTLASWQMMYLDEARGAIVIRLAPQPNGPWGAPIPLASASRYPHLYGGFLHPDSHGADIYFTMSQYDRYNVTLMHATLPPGVAHSPSPA
jgi:Domain of unknown function (DUF4185)